MKKIYLSYLVLCLTIVLSSCNKDDPKIDPIIGRWELENVQVEFAGDANAEAFNEFLTPYQLYSDTTPTSAVSRRTLNIKADKSFADDLVFLLRGNKSTESGKWDLSKKQLSLRYDRIPEVKYEVISNDGDNLQVSEEQNYSVSTIKITYFFAK